MFATINDLFTGRQKLAPGLTLNRDFILASFEATLNPLIPALTFQSAKEALAEIDFLVVLNGRDCGFGCVMVLDQTLTSLLRVDCMFWAGATQRSLDRSHLTRTAACFD